jgi:hypothetical protein
MTDDPPHLRDFKCGSDKDRRYLRIARAHHEAVGTVKLTDAHAKGDAGASTGRSTRGPERHYVEA